MRIFVKYNSTFWPVSGALEIKVGRTLDTLGAHNVTLVPTPSPEFLRDGAYPPQTEMLAPNRNNILAVQIAYLDPNTQIDHTAFANEIFLSFSSSTGVSTRYNVTLSADSPKPMMSEACVSSYCSVAEF